MTDDLLFQSLRVTAAHSVRVLTLKGCRGIRDGRTLASLFPDARSVDLSWSGIRDLPSPPPLSKDSPLSSPALSSSSSAGVSSADDSGFFDDFDALSSVALEPLSRPCWPLLKYLSLSSCPFISCPSQPDPLAAFLSALPSSLESLDLSHLRLPYSTLAPLDFLPFTREADESISPHRDPTRLLPLRISLVGNDLLTRSAIARLDALWRVRIGRAKPVLVEHDAVLESEGEDDVRRFVEMVAGGSR